MTDKTDPLGTHARVMYLLLQRFFPAIWQCEVLLVISSYYTIQKQMIKISGNSCKQLKNPFLPHPSFHFF